MSKMFGMDKPPRPKPVPVAPVPDEELDQANKERSYSRKYGNRGRTGTVLTGDTNLG